MKASGEEKMQSKVLFLSNEVILLNLFANRRREKSGIITSSLYIRKLQQEKENLTNV